MSENDQLKELSKNIRVEILKMVTSAKSGHVGGPLGLADIYAVLYKKILKHDPKDPEWEDRDRFILSNGHVCAVRYATMSLLGYFPVEELKHFRQLNHFLQGHPSTRYMKGIESSSGSLGQGLSVSIGLALSAKIKKKQYKIYTCLSDGEFNEGMTWEALQTANHYQLDNLIAFIDKNNIQIDGFTKDVMNTEPLKEKIKIFNWNVLETDGHNIKQIIETFEEAKSMQNQKPTMIVFNTVLGKGVSFMENNPKWHGSPPNQEQMEQAIDEIMKS